MYTPSLKTRCVQSGTFDPALSLAMVLWIIFSNPWPIFHLSVLLKILNHCCLSAQREFPLSVLPEVTNDLLLFSDSLLKSRLKTHLFKKLNIITIQIRMVKWKIMMHYILMQIKGAFQKECITIIIIIITTWSPHGRKMSRYHHFLL